MAKTELGTKRIDPETGRKFYDLNKDPIVSPYTGKSYPRSYFEYGKMPPSRRKRKSSEKEAGRRGGRRRDRLARRGRRGGQGRRQRGRPGHRGRRSRSRRRRRRHVPCRGRGRGRRRRRHHRRRRRRRGGFESSAASAENRRRAGLIFHGAALEAAVNGWRGTRPRSSSGRRRRMRRMRGHSSAGRALAWHARGQRFDPAWLHQIFRTQRERSGKTAVASRPQPRKQGLSVKHLLQEAVIRTRVCALRRWRVPLLHRADQHAVAVADRHPAARIGGGLALEVAIAGLIPGAHRIRQIVQDVVAVVWCAPSAPHGLRRRACARR